ncbi:MAG TPA: CocE/NonD family hydrolase, partial [Longimicrobium sp.]|nr:CocE/NonD family hydrolase [Longimicrobium sp.]
MALLLAASSANAQQLPFPAAAVQDSAALERAMPALARAVLARDGSEDPDARLNQRFRLQMVAREHIGALASLWELRALRSVRDPIYAPAEYTQYEIYARTRLRAGSDGHFADAFPAVFREVYSGLDDRVAFRVDGSFDFFLERARDDLRSALERQEGRDSISLADAAELCRRFFAHETYRRMLPLTPAALRAERARRYHVNEEVRVRTRDGAEVAAILVRPRRPDAPAPAILAFTIYADERNLARAMEAAAHGYVGVVANTRGKRIGPGPVVPYDHDGDDAWDVIDWISRQPWSDGRVGMRGGSYEGFVQWSAARRMHPALRTIVPAVAIAPGIDSPMENGVFHGFQFPWIPYVSNTPLLDEATYGDRARWEGLESRWFASGGAYRALDSLDGGRSPIFQRWIDHPTYDSYWS